VSLPRATLSPLRLLLVLVFLSFAAQAASAQQVAAPDGTSPVPTEQQSPKRPSLTFFQIVFSGGPLGVLNMLVLVALSIAALALALDNVRVVRKGNVIPPALAEEVRDLVSGGELARASAACKAQPSLLASVLAHGLAEAGGGWPDVEKSLEDATAEQAARLFRRIEYLHVIGNIAPMVGLLGTVTGMLLAFKQVADTEGNAGAAQLADGIYQALVTTVVGLIIAIPSLGAFALLRSRVDQLVAEAAYAALHALSPLKQRRPAESAPVTPPPPVMTAKSTHGAGS
jgi:biopolymer transport protein ExbB